MRAINKSLGLLAASVMLASCGGGGGSGSDGAFEPTPSGTLAAAPASVQLPVNRDNIGPGFGSPYMGEVDITWRRANGDLVSGLDVNVSINPVTIASFSMLDDPTTPWTGLTKTPPTSEGNEFLTLMGSAPVGTEGGHATIFVHSGEQTGNATLTVTARDTASPTTISKTVPVAVISGTPNLPATVNLVVAPTAVYLANSGGNSSAQVNVRVLDGNGANVPNPGTGNAGVNNVLLEVVGPANSGTITANNAAGQSNTGPSVRTRTLQGVAGANYAAGSVQGPILIRATSDAADNNVDNGIQTAVVATQNIVVSDGKLFSLKLVTPTAGAIIINSVSDLVDTDDLIEGPNGIQIPPDPDGTYSLTVTVSAQDRQGNPVLPGTPIRFGSIDHPVGAYNAGVTAGEFLISGGDGNPQEGGNLFTAPTGRFRTAGAGAGPGDALVVFGKDVQGNDDLESAQTVQNVNTETSLNTTTPFNLNNTTGNSVDYGNALPYVIGRAQHGNVTATALVDEHGAASTKLNYPVNSLGRPVIVWAQGETTDPLTGSNKRVTDVFELRYPGVAPGFLTAVPTPILGNRTQLVTVCFRDALEAPLQFIPISFRLQLLAGTGTVDGNSSPNTLDNLTGPDGCVVATVVTSGVPASPSVTTPSGTVTFSVGGLTAVVNIVVNVASIQVTPTVVTVNQNPETANITVRALDDQGAPLPGVVITATCTASGGASATISIAPGTATTAQNGNAVFQATATNFGGTTPAQAPGRGQCVFTTATGLTGFTDFFGVGCDDFSPPSCPVGP